MKEVAQELRNLVAEFESKINAIGDDTFAAKPNPAKWSKKEVLGHLIDSASNNLRRLICGQYESSPPQIAYEQDFWVNANSYRDESRADVIKLWTLINRQLCRVLEAMPPSNYNKECNTGKQSPQLRSLQWLAEDYVKHLKHHLNQIIPGSFNITYP